ncbi:hypothetical protein Tco_1059836 [Tanacetum coccineum]
MTLEEFNRFHRYKEMEKRRSLKNKLLMIFSPYRLLNPADQFIFQRRTPMPTKPSEHANSPSLDAELALIDNVTESEEEVPENLKLLTEDQVILEEPASSTGTLSSLQNLDKDLSFTNQFFVEKPQEEEPGKTNAEAEVQSMVLVPIHQDTSSVPLMTTSVIDLTKSQYDTPLPTSTATTSTITTTTTLPLPPLQSTTDPILVHRIGELEQHITDLIQNNLALEESKAVDEIVTDAVDWAMQAPLRARFRDLPTIYMKEFFNNGSDQEEARKKKRKRRESPRTPLGSPPTQPPPLPPPAGTSGAPGNQAPSSSKTDDSIPEEQVLLSDDEDSKNDHQPKADLRKDWWKPLPKEERPATPEPAWTIPSSNKSDVVNNWDSALATTYEPSAKNSLLAKIGDMTTFMN